MVRFAERFRQLQRLKIIGAYRENFERRHGAAQFSGRIREPLPGNVHGNIRNGILEMFEQHPRLHSRARSKADQLCVRADRFGHLGSMTTQDLRLGASDIIFRELGDFLEQLRAALVVKKFARERTRRTREAFQDFSEEILTDRLEVEYLNRSGGVTHAGSRASRIPVNCQRFSG